MRSSILLGAIVGLMFLWSCQNSAIVIWERDGTLHGLVLAENGLQYPLPPLPTVTITTSPEQFKAVSGSNGEWTTSLSTLSVPTTLWYVCNGYDTATNIQFDWNSGRSTRAPDVVLVSTIVDTLQSCDISVDSVTTDSIWYRVRANVPDAVPYVTICFYDTLETVNATVKKWSAVFNTYIVVTRGECDGRKLSRSINSYLFDLLHRFPLYATSAIGRPYSNYVYDSVTQSSVLTSVSGLGPLRSWTRVVIR